MRRERSLPNGHVRVFTLALMLLPLHACIKPQTEVCPSGRVCPDGLKCAASQDVCINTDCGDGITQSGEVCDDGNVQSGDGCSSDCGSDESCGNGKVDHEEVCDDGNTMSGDNCSADCKSGEGCGNGHLDKSKGELCDDGNRDNGDDCTNLCQPNVCGDGHVDSEGSRVEQCDEEVETATCNLNCTARSCGDGVVNATAGEQCDDANSSNEDNCLDDCKVATCGDGYVNREAREVCDDGNADACGTCSFDCSQHQMLVAATGSITAVDSDYIVDGDIFAISDGYQTFVFEFDKFGRIAPGNIRVNIGGLDSQGVASAILDAIDRAAYPPPGVLGVIAWIDMHEPQVVKLRNWQEGHFGNQKIVHSVNNQDFTVDGMVGGLGAHCPLKVGCKDHVDCRHGLRCNPVDPDKPEGRKWCSTPQQSG